MRLHARAAALAAASFFAATAAHASTLDEENRSTGSAALTWETRKPIVGPSTGKLGGSMLQVKVSANIDPVKDPSKPLLLVDMPKGAVVEASWVDDKSIQLALVQSVTKDGTFKVEHTLAPHVTLFINAFGFNLTYDYDATTLIDHVPGSAWNYGATESKAFDPWGFQGVELSVNGPALAKAQLFSIPIPALAGSQPLTGTIAVNATTEPTFHYDTTSAVFSGADPVGGDGRVWRVPTVDADYLELVGTVKGKITYAGDLLVRPSVTITKIGSTTLPFALTVDIDAAGVSVPFSSGAAPIAVDFKSALFHVPLPNVKAPESLDIGSAQIGEGVSKKAIVNNTGEMNAAVTFKSSDPQFVVVSSRQTAVAKGKYDLDVAFRPTKDGLQTAEITVTSNDPNQPVQVIEVTGTGTLAPPPEPEEFSRPSPDGCGCRTTAPASSDAAGLGLFGLFGLFGLAVAALVRRRRDA